VAGSDPEAEVAESDAKFIPMRDSLTAPPLHSPDR
jgi:isochorismate synthase EntC